MASHAVGLQLQRLVLNDASVGSAFDAKTAASAALALNSQKCGRIESA